MEVENDSDNFRNKKGHTIKAAKLTILLQNG